MPRFAEFMPKTPTRPRSFDKHPARIQANSAKEDMQEAPSSGPNSAGLQGDAKSEPLAVKSAPSGGQPLSTPVQRQMESAFKSDFSGVRIHNDAHAAQQSQKLAAQAFTQGRDIFFSPGRYRPETRGGVQLLAHELAHVVQQGGTTAATQAKSEGITPENDPAEQRADAAAEAVLRGRPVPYLGTLTPGKLSRVVNTKYGTFDTTSYKLTRERDIFGTTDGCEMKLQFTPNSHVPFGDKIGLIQTVNSQVGGAPSAADNLNRSLALTAHDPSRRGHGNAEVGRAIDRGQDGEWNQPNTNPVYGSQNPENKRATGLTGGVMAEHNQLGERNRLSANKPAKLFDTPGLPAGANQSQKFETAAMLVSGDKRGKYLGSVAWGWKCDAHGIRTLDPSPIVKVSDGDPSVDFLDAADKWNAVGVNQGDNLVQIPQRAHGAKFKWPWQ